MVVHVSCSKNVANMYHKRTKNVTTNYQCVVQMYQQCSARITQMLQISNNYVATYTQTKESIYVYVFVYIYMYIYNTKKYNISLFICIHLYVLNIYIYIYIYIFMVNEYMVNIYKLIALRCIHTVRDI